MPSGAPPQSPQPETAARRCAVALEFIGLHPAAAERYLGGDRTRELLDALGRLRPAGPVPPTTLNRDLFPRDEFATPAGW